MIRYFLIIIFAISFLTISCKSKDASDPDLVLIPSITSLSPEAGTGDTEVSILGENFGDNSSEVNVTFDLRLAEIIKRSDTEITVKVPTGFNDTTVDVLVSVDGRRSNTMAFTFKDSTVPLITSITSSCFFGAKVIIEGENFSPVLANNIVKFGDIPATVIDANKNSLIVTAPNLGNATMANVTVTKFNMVSNAKAITVDADQNKIATYNWTTTYTVKPGVIYKAAKLSLFGQTQRSIFVLDVTLNSSNTLGIGFSPSELNTVALCNNYGAIAGINAGYFPFNGSNDKDPYVRINSVTVQNGHTNVSQLYTNSALLIHNNVATVKKFTESGKNLNVVAAAIPITQAENIIVCGPMLITSGVIENLDMSTSHNSSSTARTGLGVTDDGKRVLMVVVDTGGGVTGVNTLQLAKILQALGAVDAMNFDGGGSSTMFVKNQGLNGLVNLPTGGTWQRPVRSVIYIR